VHEGDGYDSAGIDVDETASAEADLRSDPIRALGMEGAAVSTLGSPLGSETVWATGAWAAALDEIQLDLGEGPCWGALASGRPVLVADVQQASSASWPVAQQALRETGLGALFAFPLVIGRIDVGACALYSRRPRQMSPQQVLDATRWSRTVAWWVLRGALEKVGEPSGKLGEWGGPYSRREVHQATGMTMAQMGVSAPDALLVLRGHAFAANRTVRAVAQDVIDRALDFTRTG
jgi:GAF domain-containing protein